MAAERSATKEPDFPMPEEQVASVPRTGPVETVSKPLTAARPIRRQKLSEAVEEELERLIRSGEYPAGAALPSERELMGLFDVGRPSIREALSALARKGLVKIVSGERTRVTRPTADQMIAYLAGMSKAFMETSEGIRYFDQMRQLFESGLVRFAAEHVTEAQCGRLEQALGRNREAIGRNERFIQTDVDFHRVIAEIPENPIFLAVHEALANWVIAARPTVPDPHLHNLKSYEGHAAIFEAIRARDGGAADWALKAHLQDAYDRFYGDRVP
jgi:DNA-binding FadR family transcriptional regulator